MLKEQLELEKECREQGVTRLKNSIKEAEDRQDIEANPAYKRLLSVCLEELANILKAHLESVSAYKVGFGVSIKKALKGCSYEQLAYITLKETLTYLTNHKKKHKVASLQYIVGLAVEHLIICSQLKEEKNVLYKSILQELKSKAVKEDRHRRTVLIRSALHHLDLNRWSTSLRGSVGHFLVKNLLDNSDIFETSKRGMLRISPACKDWLDQVIESISGNLTVHQPCIVPPDDWTNLRDGGYKSIESKHCSPLLDYRYHKNFEGRDISEHLEAINTIQKTEWCVNKDLLTIASTLWASNNTSVFPSREPLKVPPYPFSDDLKKEDMTKEQQAQLKVWKKQASSVYTKEKIRLSKVLALSSTLQVANRMQKYPTLWFVWYSDYRGRVYPRSTALSPQGSCMNKALLSFKQGKAIDEESAKWLAIHGANAYGEDKINYEDRIRFINSIQKDIILYAEDPYSNTGWMDADSPWVFLAFCLEWAEYCKTGSLVSHIPVAIDGTCNGLQHFSALLRDEVGAKHTNLINASKPADIYQVVADKVTDELQKDSDNPLAQQWLKIGINRKVCKRSVMTLPYGVRSQTVSDHVYEYLKDNKIEIKDSFKACFYLGKVIWSCMSKTVGSAVQVLDYIREHSRLPLKEGRLMWVSPSGFPVKVHRLKYKTVRLSYEINGVRYRPYTTLETGNVDVQRCLNSVAPNYIHSLDASHLVKTVNTCFSGATGITSISCVHDSFGTHASDVSDLHAVLRSTFVNMYKQDLLLNFCKDLSLPTEDLPKRGSFDINKVPDSYYFFN